MGGSSDKGERDCRPLDLIRKGCHLISSVPSMPPNHPSMSHIDRSPKAIISTHQHSPRLEEMNSSDLLSRSWQFL